MIIAALTALAVLFGGGIFTFDSVRDAAEEVIKIRNPGTLNPEHLNGNKISIKNFLLTAISTM